MLDLLLQQAPRFFLTGRSDVAAAYSLRRLSGTYAGPLLRVRRSSDSAEMDFGYGRQSRNALWAGISSFVGSGNGFAVKWYDQSGNGRDLAQSTAANQAQMGLLSNGLPGMTFDGSNDAMQTSAFTLNQPNAFNIVYRRIANAASFDLVFMKAVAGSSGSGDLYRDPFTPVDNAIDNLLGDLNASQPTGTRGAVGGTLNGASSRLEVNGATIASFSGNAGAGNGSGLTLAAEADLAASRFGNIEVQELVLFSTAHSQAQLQADNAAMRRAWRF